jgi:hypothetical protein
LLRGKGRRRRGDLTVQSTSFDQYLLKPCYSACQESKRQNGIIACFLA